MIGAMKRMLGAGTAAVFLCGCLLDWFTRPEDRHGPVEHPAPEGPYAHVPEVWDRHLYGPLGDAPAGTRLTYRINESQTVELTARGNGWIEVVDSQEAPGVSLRRVGADGRITEAFYAELPYDRIVAQQIRQTPAGLRPAGFEPPPGERVDLTRTTDEETREVEEWEDQLGFGFTVETVWSRRVPLLYAGSSYGGLVRRVTPAVRVELVGRRDGVASRFSPPR